MHSRIFILVFLLLIFTQKETFGQSGFSHELGAIVGPEALYSDFGQRNDIGTNMGNTGVGIGLVHYINFYFRNTRETYFTQHFMIRNEVIYHKTNLQHYGKWVDASKTSLFADQLRAMTGSTTVIEVGSHLEYFPFDLREYSLNTGSFAPFIGVGAHWVNFNPEVKSSMGPLNSPATTPDKYVNAFRKRVGSTLAVVGSVGLRYKLSLMSDLLLSARWHYYFSDYVDGLNPSEENNGRVAVPENKSNDWMVWLNVGYIFYLDN